ncbi:MAG: radical SAM protein [Bacillota bacterium]|nr:radical SAM protein [Bacillota bacterium]
MCRHVFGPVPSRRLGRSLGIDPVPFKTCTYDCIYCQLGRTTHKTLERREFFPVKMILDETRRKLDAGPKPDYITLSGSGEPTLHSGTGDIIAGIKQMTSTPVAVLTNGSLLWLPEVRHALLQADLVMPSLDAGDAQLFAFVNRPDPGLSFQQMVEGLVSFRDEYKGAIWLEVLLLAGVTALEAEVLKLARLIDRIKPDKVLLNTVVRPPAEDFALTVPREKLSRLAGHLGGCVEVIAPYRDAPGESNFDARRDDVLALLRRRPCTIEDLAAGLGMHRNEVAKYVQELLDTGTIRFLVQSGSTYYAAT